MLGIKRKHVKFYRSLLRESWLTFQFELHPFSKQEEWNYCEIQPETKKKKKKKEGKEYK